MSETQNETQTLPSVAALIARGVSIPIDSLLSVEIDLLFDGRIVDVVLKFDGYQNLYASPTDDSVSNHAQYQKWKAVKDVLLSSDYPHGKVFYRFDSLGIFRDAPHHYSLSGSHFNYLSPEKKAELLANDVLHQEYNKINYRQKAFHEFIQHQHSLAFGFETDPNKFALYRNLCIQWAVAGFDPANFSTEANWAIIQKCQQFPILQFSVSHARGDWNDITIGSLVKPVVEGTDWLMRYPTLIEEDDVDPIAQTDASFLQNAGSVYDQNSNYAKGIHLLTYGVKSSWYGGI